MTDPAAESRPLLERLGVSASQGGALRPANPLLRRTLQVLVALVIGAFLGTAVIASLTKLPDFDWQFRPLWLTLGVAGFTAFWLSHAAVWHELLKALNQTVDRRRSRSIWCTAALARYTPGSVLMPMVRIALAEREGVAKRTCLASIVYETALVVTGAIFVGGYALVSAPAFEDHSIRYLVLALPVLALIVLHPRIFRPLTDRALDRVHRERLPFTLPFRQALTFAGLYAVTWLLAGFSLYALVQGLHPVETRDLLIILASPAVSGVAGILGFMLPAGVGARDAALAAVLSAAVPVAVAVAIAVAVRLVQLAVELVCAAVTPWLARSGRL